LALGLALTSILRKEIRVTRGLDLPRT
jgi:hypothetical protein